MRKQLLLKLADFLDNLPREKFDITIFANKDVKKNECGTKACALGWCPTVFPRSKFKLTQTFVPYYLDSKNEYYYQYSAGAKFFDIPFKDALSLFGANDDDGFVRDVTPKQLSKQIRKYVKDNENQSLKFNNEGNFWW